MSRKPRKMVEMSKDMFMIFMTWAFIMGMFAPDVFQALAVKYG